MLKKTFHTKIKYQILIYNNKITRHKNICLLPRSLEKHDVQAEFREILTGFSCLHLVHFIC